MSQVPEKLEVRVEGRADELEGLAKQRVATMLESGLYGTDVGAVKVTEQEGVRARASHNVPELLGTVFDVEFSEKGGSGFVKVADLNQQVVEEQTTAVVEAPTDKPATKSK